MRYLPLLAVATGILELGAGLWVLLGPRRGRRSILVPSGVILLLLAGYQFAEVMVCSWPEVKLWSRLAYLDITWLPPLGLWLAARLGARRIGWLNAAAWGGFALGLVFSVWILADPQAITKSVCDLVVARYFPSAPFEIAYGLFYQIGLMAMVFGSAVGMGISVDAVLRRHLANLQIGLLGFIFPSLAVRILVRDVRGDMIPSVMCHFAAILAVSLFVLVLRERRIVTPAP